MTTTEELHRKALLHTQAAELFRQDADRHEAEAKRLREEAARLKETGKGAPSPLPGTSGVTQ